MKQVHLAANQFSQRGVAAVEFAIIAVILFTCYLALLSLAAYCL